MKKRVVVVTGASAGVGRAVARMFAQDGADIALIARGQRGLDAAQEEMLKRGVRSMSIPCDVADAAEVEDAASKAEHTLGPIDVWVNNAMTTVFSRFLDMQAKEFKRVTEVTYLGVVYGTLSALRRMQPRNRGHIIQVGSALAYRSIPLQSAYCGAKHAIKGFTDSIRSELIHENSHVRLTMVQLPAMNTPQFNWCENHMTKRPQPVPPIFQPESAARAVLKASYGNYREIRVGFPTVKAIVGQKFIPGWLDGYLAKKAYDGQQTEEAAKVIGFRSNLFEPVDTDHDAGAHGRFDDEARRWCLWNSSSRGPR